MTSIVVDTAIDAHLHLWDPGTLDYPWLDGLSIAAAHTLRDVPARLGPAQVSGAVFVQAECVAEQRQEEIRWVQAQTPSAGGVEILGIVAAADLLAPDRDEVLALVSSSDRVVGIRQNIQGQPDGFARSLHTGIAEAASHGLTFDICCESQQLHEVIDLIERTAASGARLVLDHLGKPRVGDSDSLPAWRDAINAIAAAPDTACKLSGLFTEMVSGAGSEHATFAPYLDHAVDAFGIDRVLYGSDWPVCTLEGSAAQWAEIVAATIGDDAPSQRAVFHDNAARLYGLAGFDASNPGDNYRSVLRTGGDDLLAGSDPSNPGANP